MPHLIGMDEADQAEITSIVTIENNSRCEFDGLVHYSIFQEDTHQIVFEPSKGKPVSLAPGQTFSLKFSANLANPQVMAF